MSETCFSCGEAGRRREALRLRVVNGMDFVEVLPGQTSLTVTFLFPLPGEADGLPLSPPATELTADNFTVDGGERLKGIKILGVAVNGNVATLMLDGYGDFSAYTLRLRVSSTEDAVPEGFDTRLSQVTFSFKVACPNPFDCLPATDCPPEKATAPSIDYLARDFASFRRLMLDRMRVLMPDFTEQNPADPQVALVELLAYEGDKLAYAQDAVAAEAYLGNARRRISVRRHARLLDYRLHEGCAARAFVHFSIDESVSLSGGFLAIPMGTAVLTRPRLDSPLAVPDTEAMREIAAGQIAFETRHGLAARRQHNRISIYTWDDADCCLPAGATTLTLRDSLALPLHLQVGDYLLLEEVLSSTTGAAADVDTSHRQTIRLTRVTPLMDKLHDIPLLEIAWAEADALNFPLCVSAHFRDSEGVESLLEIAVARANMALVEQGYTRIGGAELLLPAIVPEADSDGLVHYRPELAQPPLVFAAPYYSSDPATLCLNPQASEAVPAMRLQLSDGIQNPETFIPLYDLLNSGPFDRDFCVEAEDDGRLFLRFGDGLNGSMPLSGSQVTTTYRLGGGTVGNVGAESITRVITTLSQPLTGLAAVRNPLPAMGGVDRESTQRVKLLAPAAFKTQRRCVTEADYADRATAHPQVQKAVATSRWTGSWYTIFLSVDRKGGKAVDTAFKNNLLDFIEPWRMAGVDIEVTDPVSVALDLALSICVSPDRFRVDVQAALLQALGSQRLPTGPAFFHPDRFTFGQSLYLSQLIAAALAVPGVDGVEVTRFQRLGSVAAGELAQGVLRAGTSEILRCDSHPSFPERGQLALDMKGGR